MADAGRILIMPKGDYNPSVSYEMLDLVAHNNISWLAKKDSVGIEPNVSNSEYWFKLTEGGGDASTLGGKSASEYASFTPPINNVPSGADLNTYTNGGEWAIISSAITATLVNKPSGFTKGGRLIVQTTQNDGVFYQIILSSNGIFVRYYNGTTFEAWDEFATTADLANYLPKTGGTVSNSGGIPLTLQGSNVSYVKFTNSSGAQLGLLGAYTDGSIVYSDGSIVNKLLHSGNVGSYALPIGGGKVTGATTIEMRGGVPLVVSRTDAEYVPISFVGKSGQLGYLGFNGVDNPEFRTASGQPKALLHTGNSAKVVVSQTPLTSAGSIRVW